MDLSAQTLFGVSPRKKWGFLSTTQQDQQHLDDDSCPHRR
jgi:hypothetical protein